MFKLSKQNVWQQESLGRKIVCRQTLRFLHLTINCLFFWKHFGFCLWVLLEFFFVCLNWLLWSFGIVGYSDMFQTIDLPIIELSVLPACTTSWNKYNFLHWFESTWNSTHFDFNKVDLLLKCIFLQSVPKVYLSFVNLFWNTSLCPC